MEDVNITQKGIINEQNPQDTSTPGNEAHDKNNLNNNQSSFCESILSPITILFDKFINKMTYLQNKYPRYMGRIYWFLLSFSQTMILYNVKV